MKRIPISKILVLLATLAAYSGTAWGQHRITEVQYPSVVGHTIVREYTFPATPTFLSDRIMTSLDRYNTQQHFLTMGTDNGDPSKVNYFIQPLQSGAVCAMNLGKSGLSLNYAVKIDKLPYTVCTSVLTCEKRDPVKYLKLDQETICSD